MEGWYIHKRAISAIRKEVKTNNRASKHYG